MRAIILQIIQLLFLFAVFLYVVILYDKTANGIVVNQSDLNVAHSLGLLIMISIDNQISKRLSESYEEESKGKG